MGSCRLMMAATTMSSGLHSKGATSHRQQPQSSQIVWLALLSSSRALATLCKQGHLRSLSTSVHRNGHCGARGLQERLEQLQQAVPGCRPVSMILSRPAAHGAKQRVGSGKHIAWHSHGAPPILHRVGAGGVSQRGHLAASQVVCILGSIQRPLQLLLCNSCCLLQQAGHRSGEKSTVSRTSSIQVSTSCENATWSMLDSRVPREP